MKTGLQRLKAGDFNTMHVEHLSDGSQIVTLVKDGWGGSVKFRVLHLYEPGEQELDIVTGKPVAKE